MALNIAIEILILWAVYAIYMGIVVFKRGPVGGLCFYPKVMQKRVIEISKGVIVRDDKKGGYSK